MNAIPPAMTFEQIKANESHRVAIKRQAIQFYKSNNAFADDRPMQRWLNCVSLVVDAWIHLGPQRDHVPTKTFYL